MRWLLRWTKRLVAVLVLLLILVGVAGYFWLRTSLPQTNGMIVVNGVDRPVEIIRDANAVPHIFAESDRDAYYALGFVHAQDRFWQMELQRRIGAGRLAEIVGRSALRIDKFARTLGYYRRARAALPNLSPEVRAALEAYSAGVNSWLASRGGALPPELELLRIKPEPWQPADSLVWARLMSQQLSSSWFGELQRARVAARIGPDKLADLWPPYPGDGPVTIARRDTDFAALRRLPLDALAAALPGELMGGGASNEWVLSGRLTATGRPILANDPHLGLTAPALWYLARVEAPDLSVTGATVPGVPFTLLGHDRSIAWGFTTSYIDTDDLFIEKIDPNDPNRYVTPDGTQPFVSRQETIQVRGDDPVTIVVRETRHGPVISDALPPSDAGAAGPGYVLALQATWLRDDDRTAEAIYKLNRAQNWDGFVDALRSFDSPAQNIAYADTAGNIGMYMPAAIPIRKSGNGFLPAPGWTGDHDWAGVVPFEERPHSYNPPSGRLINANNKIAGDSYPFFLTNEWGDYLRARRLAGLLNTEAQQSLASSAMLQADVVSPMARDLLPLMMTVPPANDRARHALALLKAWDGTMDRNRPEPLIFTAWLRELNRLLYADELGDLFPSYWEYHPDVVRLILTERREWCDDVRTPAKESCDDRVAAALVAALDKLAERRGSDLPSWRWGDEHYADMRHRVFDYVPLLRGLANIRIPSSGGNDTIDRAGSNIADERAPFAARNGPGYRAIYDLSDLARSRFIQATGQSGNLFSANYEDMVTRWRDVEYISIAGTRDELKRSAAGTLTLEPVEKKP
ncbi:MAG TPA: penicillin acylase family protein [Alphaproteobacteria bacterium]|jgi:penicillin amidase|nr:penicillin acylase family protein [Alphaproteobacteria bacterium]